MRENLARAMLAAGATIVGPNLQIASTALVEIIGHEGFHFVMLDGEHGAVRNELQNLFLAADASRITAMVRVPSHDRGHLLEALELGAGAVVVPMIETPEQAAAVAAETKYAPVGRRGFSNATRAARYGAVTEAELAETLNRETLCIVQVETQQALERAPDIARVPGVDVVFVGPSDLAQSLGYPGQPKAPEVVSAMRELVRAVRPHAFVGTSAFSGEDVRAWRSEGVQMFLTWSTTPIRNAFRELWRELAPAAGAE